MKENRSLSRLIRPIGLFAVVSILGVMALQAHWNEPKALAAFSSQQDKEKEVQAYLTEVAATFNKHDAKAVGTLFLPEGELVDADGNVLKTRAALEEHYGAIFKAKPQSQLAVTKETLRLISDNLAMFDGQALVKPSPQEPQRQTRFAAVLSKQGNQWYIASIRDLEDIENGTEAIKEKMQALNWLVGEWVQEGSNFSIHTKCRWSEDKMSLIQQFQIVGANLKELSGTQRISWDPATEKIKSWTHDTQGGYAEALWTRNGNGWIVKSTGTNSDGDACSMTMVYQQAGEGRIDLYSRDRIAGDEVMPDIAATLVRKPPEAKP